MSKVVKKSEMVRGKRKRRTFVVPRLVPKLPSLIKTDPDPDSTWL
jgi:hypothetical protein